MPTKNLSLDEDLKDKMGPLRSKILLVKMEEKRIIL
jgi:hypothetical protein